MLSRHNALRVFWVVAGREGAVCDKPPYVERGVFTTDWGLSQQRSQGEEDLAELTEEDWQAEMEAVRHWELRELAALEAEDRSEHGRYERSKSIREKIANPNWRPWRYACGISLVSLISSVTYDFHSMEAIPARVLQNSRSCRLLVLRCPAPVPVCSTSMSQGKGAESRDQTTFSPKE